VMNASPATSSRCVVEHSSTSLACSSIPIWSPIKMAHRLLDRSMRPSVQLRSSWWLPYLPAAVIALGIALAARDLFGVSRWVGYVILMVLFLVLVAAGHAWLDSHNRTDADLTDQS
jgi:hypothetical protein